MPRAWARDNRPGVPDSMTNSLANFAIIARAENREIKAKAPSEYRTLMGADINAISASAYLPDSLWADDESKFFDERAQLLAAAAQVRLV